MRSFLTINLKKLQTNIEEIRKINNKKIIAVIKSNAYGLGIINIANFLLSKDIDYFAVATLEEAILLRKNKIRTNILVLEKSNDYLLFQKYNLTYVVYDLYSLKEIQKYKVKFHIKIDTGLNRLGISINEIDELKQLIKNKSNIEGIFTHIASINTYEIQLKKFDNIIKKLDNINFKIIHIDSSRFISQTNTSTHIRIGLSLFVYKENIISLESPIIRIKEVNKDDLVGYHNQEKTPCKGYLLTIPLGYADGWNKDRRTIGFINGTKIQQIGETCMDHMMFFSKEKPKNETIELIGDNLKIDYLENIYNESKYQIFASLSYRLKRIYTK